MTLDDHGAPADGSAGALDSRLASVDARIAALDERVGQLTDLFTRRLYDDKVKRRAFDELYAQLEVARSEADATRPLPVLRELMLVIDRLDGYGGPDPAFVRSVGDELREILARHGVEPITPGDTFDPAVHEAVEVVDDPDVDDGRIVAVRRDGYRLAGRVLRPVQVVVGRNAHRVRSEARGAGPDG